MLPVVTRLGVNEYDSVVQTEIADFIRVAQTNKKGHTTVSCKINNRHVFS